MVKINFISVSSKTVVKHLVEVLDVLLQHNYKICILVNNQQEAENINSLLWSQSVFLPHTLVNTKIEEQTPVVISYDSIVNTKNKPNYLIILNNTNLENFNEFNNIDIIFNENDNEIKEYNRKRWKNLKTQEFEINVAKI